MPGPPGIVMVASPEISRNAQPGKVKAAQSAMGNQRGQGQYKGRSPKAPAPALLLLSSRGAGITLGTLGRQLLLKPVPQRLQVLQNPRQGEPYRPLLDVLKRL